MVGVHDKDGDVSVRNAATDAANASADSHAADEDRPTVDETRTSISPPRVGIDWSRKHPVRGGDSCAGRTQFDSSFKRGAEADDVGVNWVGTRPALGAEGIRVGKGVGTKGTKEGQRRKYPATPLCMDQDRAPICADWHDVSVRADWHNISVCGRDDHSLPIHPPRVLVLSLPPSSTATFFLRPPPRAFDTPHKTSSASTSAYSPLRVRVFPSSAAASLLPPGPASAYAFDTPQHDEQRFLLRTDISRTFAGTAPTDTQGSPRATASPGRAVLPPLARARSLTAVPTRTTSADPASSPAHPTLPKPIPSTTHSASSIKRYWQDRDADDERGCGGPRERGGEDVDGGRRKPLRVYWPATAWIDIAPPCADRLGVYGDDAAVSMRCRSPCPPQAHATCFLRPGRVLDPPLHPPPITRGAALASPAPSAAPPQVPRVVRPACHQRRCASPGPNAPRRAARSPYPVSSAICAPSSPLLRARFWGRERGREGRSRQGTVGVLSGNGVRETRREAVEDGGSWIGRTAAWWIGIAGRMRRLARVSSSPIVPRCVRRILILPLLSVNAVPTISADVPARGSRCVSPSFRGATRKRGCGRG
ncbi:hypothetical protein C8R44DRAFT_322525 [Mycena epipterygia]|nr:hypothetical protein C8R44DRAFT_322525 [Mycena epipterygia]